MTDTPKLMSPEEIEAVRAPWDDYFACRAGLAKAHMLAECKAGTEFDIPRLLSHIAALQAENERMRAALREFRTAFDAYQGSEGCTCCEKSDHTTHAETMARLMKEPEA